MSFIAGDRISREYKSTVKLMGNIFEITLVCDDEDAATYATNAAIEEIQRIERLLTTFDESSETNDINRHAGIMPIAVSDETFQLIKRSLGISKLTDGAFDITYGSIDKRLWNFERGMTSLPDAGTAKKCVRLINYKNVILDEAAHTVMLKEKGMRIGFGAIGKGYAAEKAKQLLIKLGIQSGIVNASGDLVAWGSQANEHPWTIGIANPDAPAIPIAILNFSNRAIATSGNYEKFVFINGRRYSHTINPKTGLPATGIKSVTIIAANAELADALTTPVMVMGVQAGLNMINQISGVECIIIDDYNRTYCSKNINLL